MPLSQVQAQDHAVETLKKALAGGRIHHAYLFAGPDGVGKGLCAQGLAEALLCMAPRPDGDACGQCSACARAKDRQHPDLHVVARRPKPEGGLESHIKVEQVRELQQALSFKSFEGARRVVLLFEPDRMNAATSNALLKTLEEPGPGTHFVLICAAAHLLLPTIVSRCQRVRFGPLPRELVAKQLIAQAELSPEMASLLAGLAEGSVGRGLALSASPLLAQRQALISQIDNREGLKQVELLLDLAEDLGKKKDELPLLFHLLRTWYRDLALVREGFEEAHWIHRDQAAALRARAERLSFDAILDRLGKVSEVEDAIINRQANPRLFLETLFLSLAGEGRVTRERGYR